MDPAVHKQNIMEYSSNWILPRQLRLILAGSGAGAIAKSCVAPFERVKILCQAGESKGMVDTFKHVLKKEGIWGFWRGNHVACARIIPHKGILFGFNDTYRTIMKQFLGLSKDEKLRPLYASFCGSMSGFTAGILTYPLDLVRTRMAGKLGPNSKHSTMYKTFSSTVREEGFFALYRGIGPTLFGALPYEGIKFGIYELLRQLTPEEIDHGSFSFFIKLMCGSTAGMVATIFMYPNDTIRRRLQMQGVDGKKRIYKHSIDCYRQLIRNEGFSTLYRGLTPTVIRSIPNMGIQFSMYEVLRSIMLDDQ